MGDKKAEDIRVIDLKKIKNSVTDYFVLATGNSNTHVDSIADGIEADVFKKYKERPWKKEGKEKTVGKRESDRFTFNESPSQRF